MIWGTVGSGNLNDTAMTLTIKDLQSDRRKLLAAIAKLSKQSPPDDGRPGSRKSLVECLDRVNAAIAAGGDRV